MARISVVTISYTIYLAYFYLLCKGWSTTIAQLSRNQATNLTMIMGAVYLAYSAYFLSTDFTTISKVMDIILCLTYIALSITYGANCKVCLNTLNEYLRESNEQNMMNSSLRIKRNMVRSFMFGVLGFCFTKIFRYGIVNQLND